MSYWSKNEAAYEQALATVDWNTLPSDLREAALLHFNALYTDKEIQASTSDRMKNAVDAVECAKLLHADPSVWKQGVMFEMPAGTKCTHLTRAHWLGIGDINSDDDLELAAHFSDYVEGKRGLWFTERANIDSNYAQICELADELGLFSFGRMTQESPIIVFNFSLAKPIPVFKPTWVHAFYNWYFDPSPETESERIPYGRARVLQTGELKRKEWWVHKDSLKRDNFKLDDVRVSHRSDTDVTDWIDFREVGDGYFRAVESRIKKLGHL
ncbi:hypothetical protein [Noviherbaspirillum pedocola]|uniref:Uncharacterized protein n=1 Tax=Noviherbaspirillum pedocola TaxID=2801341 RepID=A0A934T3H3_9BURK|nr:hypothetical protein [Noviherbaspirillum pedocola]MBK4738929.1 hypothetical protein [Noviherbaspirillum pedocola]